MKIIKKLEQHRRDFSADVICEWCGNTDTLQGGYDDRYYHDQVIPNMVCIVCGHSRNDLGVTHDPTPTRYAEGDVV